MLGATHTSSLLGDNILNVAIWLLAGTGHAMAAFEELLADRLRVPGSDHPQTITTRNDLAYWREQARSPHASTSDNTVYKKVRAQLPEAMRRAGRPGPKPKREG